MQRFVVLSFYLLALILDSIRAFYFSFSIFASQDALQLYSYLALSFLSAMPVLWFSLIVGERRAPHALQTLLMLKFFSMLSSVLFLSEKFKREGFPLLQEDEVHVLFFLCADFVMLLFALFRGGKLCR